MKIGVGMLLTILILLAGCAQGYYAARNSGYQEEEGTKIFSNPYTNPETEAEKAERIWREESHH